MMTVGGVRTEEVVLRKRSERGYYDSDGVRDSIVMVDVPGGFSGSTGTTNVASLLGGEWHPIPSGRTVSVTFSKPCKLVWASIKMLHTDRSPEAPMTDVLCTHSSMVKLHRKGLNTQHNQRLHFT